MTVWPLLIRITLFLGLPAGLSAGEYGPQRFEEPEGTRNLGDGSSLISSHPDGALIVAEGGLRPTPMDRDEAAGVYVLPDLDPNNAIDRFEARFDLDWEGRRPSPSHFVFHFGPLPEEAPEIVRRFELDDGLALQIEARGFVTVFCQGQWRGHFPFPLSAHSWRLRWEHGQLSLSVGEQPVIDDLPVPRLIPHAGDRFAFSAGDRSSPLLDNVRVETKPLVASLVSGFRINEILAVNEDGAKDEDGERHGWIEIANGTETPMNLEGKALRYESSASEAMTWLFPPRTLAPGNHLVVWASGKNRAAETGSLHTNFTLGSSGSLHLEGHEVSYLETRPDHSFGWREGEWRHHEVPTPGAINRGPAARRLPLGPVTFSHEDGVLTEPITLTLSAEGAPIHYTLDRTIPTTASPILTGPLTIDRTVTVRARAGQPGHLLGPVSTRSFLFLAPEVQAFESNLPIILADSAGVNLDIDRAPESPRPHYPVFAAAVDVSPESGRAKLTDTPTIYGLGGMHVRGNSSAKLFPKKQYAWEIRDEWGDDKDVPVLGMAAEADWILHAPYSDKTLMRNVLAYECARELYGRQGAVRTRYVEVFFDQGGDGRLGMDDYRGVYLLIDKNKRGQDRIDISKPGKDPETITGGYLFKKDKALFDDVTFRTAVENHQLGFVYPKDPDNAQQTYLKGYLDAFERMLHSDAFTDPDHGYASFLDVDSFIDLHWMVEIFREIDGFRISAYFTKDRYGKITAMPVWDYNLSLGNVNYGNGANPQGWYHRNIAPNDYPWFARLFEDPAFQQRWEQRYHELRRTVFATDRLMARIDAHATTLAEAAPRNFARWPVLGNYVWPNPPGFQERRSHADEVAWLKSWWTNRLQWLDAQFVSTPLIQHDDEGKTFTLTLPPEQSGTIYYTTDGSAPGIAREQRAQILSSQTARAQVHIPSPINGGAALQQTDWVQLADPPNKDQWSEGGAGVGYERGDTNFAPFINHPVDAMANRFTSCYIRIPFHLPDTSLAEGESLVLKMRADDGFVAYVNGKEVARRNAPKRLTWLAAATGSRDDGAAIQGEKFDITSFASSLREGENLLAIHGLNRERSSSDALWHAELMRVDRRGSGPTETASVYEKPIAVTQATTLRAATLHQGRWSAPVALRIQPGVRPVAPGDLAIVQADADPDVLSGDAEAYEYVRIQNRRQVPVRLRGLRIREGIRVRLHDVVLPARGTGVLVRHAPAFHQAYGSEDALLGEFCGSLRDEGEPLVLENAQGEVILHLDLETP